MSNLIYKKRTNQDSDCQKTSFVRFFCSIINLKDLIIVIFKIENLFVPSSFYINIAATQLLFLFLLTLETPFKAFLIIKWVHDL